MLLLEEKEISAWKTTDRYYPALGPNAKGPTLYNMFLELKGEGNPIAGSGATAGHMGKFRMREDTELPGTR